MAFSFPTNHMSTIIGTSHYVSRAAAELNYHRKEGGGDVESALSEGRIHIGKPATKPGETLFVKDGRYHINVQDADVSSTPRSRQRNGASAPQ